MQEFITVMLVPVGAVLAVFSAHELFFLVASVAARLRGPTRAQPEGRPGTRFCVGIPAHNEELLVGGLVDSVRRSDYPAALYDIVVVADNCEDRTASIAREHAAQVFERLDAINRGKPYALNWVLQRLDLERYDAFVILDTDTVIDPAFLTTMSHELRSGSKAIQGYFGVMNPNETWLTRLSILPGVLKFRLHNPGKMLLYATDAVEKLWPTLYGQRGGVYLSEGGHEIRNSYGNLADPADGYIWDFANRAGVSVRGYGEFASWETRGGPVTATVPGLQGRVHPSYPPYDLSIPDNERVDVWLEEFRRFEKEGGLPRLNIIRLGNDHTEGTRPGALHPRAMVAENDVALGRVVEASRRAASGSSRRSSSSRTTRRTGPPTWTPTARSCFSRGTISAA